jgi:hypothetical protein
MSMPVRSGSGLDRRALLKRAAAWGGGASLAASAGLVPVTGAELAEARARRCRARRRVAPAPAPPRERTAFGAGTYTDASVANQASTFTIGRSMVSCGVGTIASGGWSGPFAMLMYSTRIALFEAESLSSYIRAAGRMRSITQMLGKTVEDVEHDFVAIAHGRSGGGRPRFDVHFVTPFWDPGNPMATRSEDYPGKCRFGGEMLIGEIMVGP